MYSNFTVCISPSLKCTLWEGLDFVGRLVRLPIRLEPGGSPGLAEHEALLFRAALAFQQQDAAQGRTHSASFVALQSSAA